MQTNGFYLAVATSVRKSKSSEVTAVAGDFNAQIGTVGALGACLGEGALRLVRSAPKKRDEATPILCTHIFWPSMNIRQISDYSDTGFQVHKCSN